MWSVDNGVELNVGLPDFSLSPSLKTPFCLTVCEKKHQVRLLFLGGVGLNQVETPFTPGEFVNAVSPLSAGESRLLNVKHFNCAGYTV